MTGPWFGVAARAMALLLAAGILFAQADRGRITGTVTDPGGALVPDAQITATQISTSLKFKGTTTEAGEFTLPSLPVGDYRVIVESLGFKAVVHARVTLTAGSTLRLDTKLEIGAVQQSIVVSAQSSLLQADDAKLQNEMPNRLLEGLPTVVAGSMRSPFDIAALTAGANGGDTDFRVGGGQQGSWGVTLDGASAGTNRSGSTLWAAVNAPSLDAVDQFTVVTNGFKAEFGRAGGGAVTFVSKSGTNQYHGTAFDFIRNNFFDARGFFAKSVSVYRQHDLGATLGGPVRIPRLYNGKDKTFFFLSYEGFRNRAGVTTSAIAVPPAEFYNGDFHNLVANAKNPDGSYIPIVLYDPSTTTYDAATNTYIRTAFPGNQVPVNRFDPVSAKIVALAKQTLSGRYRTDVVPGTWQYWQQNMWQSGSTINPNNKYSIKIDHDLTEKHRLSGYFGYSKKSTTLGPDGPPGIPGVLNGATPETISSPVYRASWDYTVNSHIHNRFSFGANIFKDNNYPLAWNQGWKAQGICIANVPNCDVNLPMIGTGEFGTWGGNGWNGSGSPTYSFNDSVDWIKGKHSFKVGYQYEWTPYQAIGEQNVSGQVGFSAGYTQQPSSTQYTGMAFASFLLGDVSSSNVTSPRFFNLVWNYNAWFFQDDWRVTPNLTLNLGIRYEFNFPTTLQGNKCSDFNPNAPNPGATGRLGALTYCGNGASPLYMNASGPPGWYKGIGPRFGFSWSANGKTVIRGGIGRNFGPLKSLSGSAHFTGFAFLAAPPGGSDQSGGITPAFQLSQGMPAWPRPPLIDATYANNSSIYYWQGQEANRLPEYYNWNLTIQREIRNGFMIEIGYSAMAGAHLLTNELDFNRIDINRLPASASIFTAAGRNTLNAAFNSKSINLAALGFSVPYPQFPVTSSLAQSLRPYPQYTSIDVGTGGGDHSGHSTYHSMVLKVTRRYAHGLVLDASYVLSKMFTNAESMGNSNSASFDAYNLQLDKHVSGSDRTHDVKVNWVYELPIGPGKKWLRHGLLSQVIGGWRAGTTQRYATGTPMTLSGAFGFPGNTLNNRPYITTYDDWRAPTVGSSFDPGLDRFYRPATIANWTGDTPTITQAGWFPLQPRDRVGNMTVNNPKVRNFPLLNENVSLAKTFSLAAENRRELNVRLEGFNVMNRVQFGSPNNDLGSASLGLVTSQANLPRNLQLALKFMW